MNRQYSILIVDDDSDDRDIIRDAFKANRKGVQCESMENGDNVLSYLESNEEKGLPDLILLDLNMPGKDGREVLKELKDHPAFHPIPVIIFTTSSSVHDKQVTYDLGANCFVTKPDTFNKLVEVTRQIANLWLPEE